MLWILRTPLMRRTAPMVLVLGVVLSGGSFARASPVEQPKPAHKPDKSTHKTDKSITKADKSTHSAPSASTKASPASSQRASNSLRSSGLKPARTAAASSLTGAHRPAARLSASHESAHRLAPSVARVSRSRATTGRNRNDRSINGRAGRHSVPARTASLSGRRRLRSSLRYRDLPVSLAPVPEVISLHRRDLGLSSPLRGSFASLERQDEISEGEDGLERIQDEDDLQDRIAHNFLIPVPTSADLAINQNLPETHRYCRPWTAQFLADLARRHAALFHSPLEVSSAVRTVDYQKQLQLTNGNAAAAEGDVASPHLTGAAVDIPKSNMTRDEIAWMRTSLLALEKAGKLDVEEEFLQRCFHITVYKSYATVQESAAPPGSAAPLEAVDSLARPAPTHSKSLPSASRRARAAAHDRGRTPARALANPAKALPA
jgi:hypothetical protein